MRVITLKMPASKNQEIITEPGQVFELGFPASSVIFHRTNADLVINHVSGQKTILLNFFNSSMLAHVLPGFMIEGQQFSYA